MLKKYLLPLFFFLIAIPSVSAGLITDLQTGSQEGKMVIAFGVMLATAFIMLLIPRYFSIQMPRAYIPTILFLLTIVFTCTLFINWIIGLVLIVILFGVMTYERVKVKVKIEGLK